LEWRLPLRRTWWLWLAGGIALLCAIALTWALTGRDWASRDTSQGFTYRLPGTPPFLTESLALAKASESLARAAGDSLLWRPEECLTPTKAPDGTPDVYLVRYSPTNTNVGVITFATSERNNETWVANVQLSGNTVYCTLSRSKSVTQRAVVKPE
jgi:hypothetical protein